MSDEYSRGEIHFSLTFDVASSDQPEQIARNIEHWLSEKFGKNDYPYEQMELVHVDMEGREIEYGPHDYWDKESYLEDTRER